MSDSSNCYLNASRQSHNSFRSICLVQLVYYHSQKEWVGVDIPHVVKYCRTPIVITLNQSFLVCRMFVFEISEYLCVAWCKNKDRLVLLELFLQGILLWCAISEALDLVAFIFRYLVFLDFFPRLPHCRCTCFDSKTTS